MVVIFPVENCKILILDENFPAGAIPGVGPFLTPKTPLKPQKGGLEHPGLLGKESPFERTWVPKGPKRSFWGVSARGGPPRPETGALGP